MWTHQSIIHPDCEFCSEYNETYNKEIVSLQLLIRTEPWIFLGTGSRFETSHPLIFDPFLGHLLFVIEIA